MVAFCILAKIRFRKNSGRVPSQGLRGALAQHCVQLCRERVLILICRPWIEVDSEEEKDEQD